MRQRYCRACLGWHPVDEEWPTACISHFGIPHWENQSDAIPTPRIITDTMVPVQSMLDGKMYDSKAALRSTYKAAGMVEVGNDVKTTPKAPEKPKRAEVRASVEKAFSKAGLGA